MWNFHLDMEFVDEFFWQLNLLDPTFKLDAYTWHGSGLKWKIRVQKKRDGQSPGQQVLVNLELFVFLANLRSRVKWEAKMTFVNLSPRAKQEAKRVSKISLISNNTIMVPKISDTNNSLELSAWSRKKSECRQADSE